MNRNDEFIKFVLAKNIINTGLNIQDLHGFTPLDHAFILELDDESLMLLMKHGARSTLPDNDDIDSAYRSEIINKIKSLSDIIELEAFKDLPLTATSNLDIRINALKDNIESDIRIIFSRYPDMICCYQA